MVERHMKQSERRNNKTKGSPVDCFQRLISVDLQGLFDGQLGSRPCPLHPDEEVYYKIKGLTDQHIIGIRKNHGFWSCALRKDLKYPKQIISWQPRPTQSHGVAIESTAKFGKTVAGPILLGAESRAMMVTTAPII